MMSSSRDPDGACARASEAGNAQARTRLMILRSMRHPPEECGDVRHRSGRGCELYFPEVYERYGRHDRSKRIHRRSTVKSGHNALRSIAVVGRCLSANTRYSITLSARSRIDSGNLIPSAFAALMFITNSNLVGCSMGRSAGLAPLRILST